jgi:hypothetical protein
LPNPSLADRFVVPPLDVLDARQGTWRERKRKWLSIGIQSEVGRDATSFHGMARRDPRYYDLKRAKEVELGHELTAAEFEADHYTPRTDSVGSGKSVFDPVLCELAYRWFTPTGGTVIDPFAGGSVRGLVASMLGRHYVGNDLSATQCAENRRQADALADAGLIGTHKDRPLPMWTVGDSAEWVTTLTPASADLLFTCPPYYGLEKYSDDPVDLSAMTYADFDRSYATILAGAARALRPNRWAVIVTGDVRDGRGQLHDLRGSTITAAEHAGLHYTSGAVLLNMIGSVSMFAGRTFAGTRTLSRVHQDVLVFCNGRPATAAQECGVVDPTLPPEILGPDEDGQPLFP